MNRLVLETVQWSSLANVDDVQPLETSDVEVLEETCMTPKERERMNELCGQIATEQDPEMFDRLVKELNELLEQKHERIHPDHKPN